MVQATPFIVHVAALLLSTLSCCSAENVYCVRPTQPTATSCSSCPHNSAHCATLSEYAQQAKSYFTSDSTMVFLPGDHTLDMNITVANIPRLTMRGESSSGYTVTVACSGSVGLSFTGMVDFKIHSLTFLSCGRSFDKPALPLTPDKYTLLLESIEYVELVNCSFHNNLGTALTVYRTSIALAENNEFAHNHCDHEGLTPNSCVGTVFAGFNTSLSFTGTSNFINNSANYVGAIVAGYNTSLRFTGTCNFINNSAKYGGAIAAGYNTSLSFIGTSNFINNSANYVGAIAAGYNTSLSFTGANNFINNSADYGGAIAAVHKTSLSISGTSNFINNSAKYGGAIFAGFNTSLSFTGTSNFISNSADLGGAIDAWQNSSLSFNETSNFINNSADGGGAIYASYNTSLSFNGASNFINSSAEGGGAIYAGYNTSLSFTGTSNFINSSAKNMGGGVLLANCTFSVSSNTIIYWESNHARLGGAIYVEDEYNPLVYCTQSVTHTTKDKCFFQLPGQNVSSGIDAQFVFKDNSANDAGSVLYSGAIDYCKLTDLESSSSGEVFDMLVHIENDNTNSSISSEPYHICPCENNRPDCSKSDKVFAVYPGETFQISMVAVGQRNGTVPATVRGHLASSDHSQLYSTTSVGNLHPLQYLQATFNTCTILNYSVFSLQDKVVLELYADGPCSTFSNKLDLNLKLKNTCPPGFSLSEIERSCVCNQRLAEYTKHCEITNGLGQITHSSNDQSWSWVGYDKERNALILHPHCPFDYCVSHRVDFPLNNTDLQCAYNRSGLLCGACKKGYSLVLGTSQCNQCTNIHLVLLIPFALMGLALVFFLLVSKLTVATGTLSGLVFYANIVGVNHTLFIPVESTDVLSIVLAWLNLDFGVETCFYEGMDAYSKTWLQFVFPVYIWVIVGLIILASHFSHKFTKLLGNNPVSVLATLILLSYTKILRNLIAALYITYLEYPTYNRGVWLYDANIDYLSIKHIPLFVLAILVFLFLFVPYTILLLFGQWLQAISHLWLFAWVNSARLKFFMDSYHAPYKARHRYWPGLLLVVRFILLLAFALNPQQDPSINLLAILVGTSILQLWAWSSGGVYKSSYLDVLEGSFALNLIILVGSTMYVNLSGGNQLAVGYTSVAIALVTFIGILAFQLADVTGLTQCLKRKYRNLNGHNRHLGQAEAQVESESDTDSLPDRLVNPNGYEALSATAPEHGAAEPIEAVNEDQRRLITVSTYGSIN